MDDETVIGVLEHDIYRKATLRAGLLQTATWYTLTLVYSMLSLSTMPDIFVVISSGPSNHDLWVTKPSQASRAKTFMRRPLCAPASSKLGLLGGLVRYALTLVFAFYLHDA